MKLNKLMILAALLVLPMAVSAQTREEHRAHERREKQERKEHEIPMPAWGIKTNLLWDATGTANLGVEFRLGGHTSLDIPFNYNNWDAWGNGKYRYRHFMVQPELRWWPKETFRGFFMGLHGHYATFDVGPLPKPPFSQYMKDHRFHDGWLAGAGISVGYRVNFSRHWALEATIGGGYAYMKYNKYACGTCDELLKEDETKHYFGPTRAGISLIYGIGGKPAPKPVYVPEPVVVVVYEPNFTPSFITPAVETVKARSESGKAYLDFVVARSEINPNLRNNAAELQKIYNTIEEVKKNPDATVTNITITGYASPEGSYASNMTLSERRAQSLRNYVRSTFGLQDNLITAFGKGEDWTTLESLVNSSSMPEKSQILGIIRSGEDFDARERSLKAVAGGVPYRHILAEFYPQLRRSDYTIDYTVAPFTVEKGKEVMLTRPGDLSLNEMFTIANTYAPGSQAYNDVFVTAARVFPESDVANVNAAAIALSHKDTATAARHLAKVKNHGAEYWNNMGILHWLQGDTTKANESFKSASSLGSVNAKELERHIMSKK